MLSAGADEILKGEYDYARECAIIARYFEQFIAVVLKRIQATIKFNKVEEVSLDLHTLVKFFRHRIPCSCLDEKYEEVKNVIKVGMCYNKQCNLPNRMTERRKSMYCSRCRCATYCSRECQKAHWSTHGHRARVTRLFAFMTGMQKQFRTSLIPGSRT